MAVATSESTPVRLLDAAERLVGERGVDAVSLRAINAAAGTNVAAAHYHFRSKEALVRAALDRRMSVLSAQRFAALRAFDHDRAPTARDVAAVLVRPLFELAIDPEGARYVAFLNALYRAGDPWLELLDAAFAPQWERIEPVLSRATPALEPRRRARRLSLASETMLRMLADPDRYGGDLDPDAFRDEVVDVFTAIITGPCTEEAP